MIWAKTEAGRVEMQARALVKERARRNLLLLIDGMKSEETLLANLTGISVDDFLALQALKLIAPATAATTATATGATASQRGNEPAAAPSAATPPPPLPQPAGPLDYGEFTAALTRLISSHLGLRGFVLTLAVEKAGTIEELQAVAQRTLEQIRERKGEVVATTARQALYGS
ncbi:MAG: hypothetical protein M3Y67_04200 [Pseudomonadota bacterium]|nr:hypothetical protein [Pseudomonadota bacterium]